MKNMQLAGIVMALVATFAAPGARASVTVGSGSNAGTCYPFGCPSLNAITAYQQVYSATAFSGVQAINTLSFAKAFGLGTFDTATYTISLSTTAKSVLGLDTDNIWNNVGADNIVLGTFTLSGAAPLVLSFSGAEFDYDPALGNLLLNVAISNVTTAGPNLLPISYAPYFAADQTTSVTSNLYGNVDGYRQGNFALITTFDLVTPTNVPEPMTASIIGIGLLGMAAVRRHKKK